MPAFPPNPMNLPRPGPRVFARMVVVPDITNDMTGVVASATGSGVVPAVMVAVAPAASVSTASAPVPNFGEGIVPTSMSATGSSTAPAVAIAVAPATSVSTGSMPVPNFGEGIVPSAASATGSSTLPGVALTFSPPAASAAASATAPTADTGVVVVQPPPPVVSSGGTRFRFVAPRRHPRNTRGEVEFVIDATVRPLAATAEASAVPPTVEVDKRIDLILTERIYAARAREEQDAAAVFHLLRL